MTAARNAQDYDIIVVGSVHNGMIAAYLARAGLKVAVFERRPLVGGVCGASGYNAARVMLGERRKWR